MLQSLLKSSEVDCELIDFEKINNSIIIIGGCNNGRRPFGRIDPNYSPFGRIDVYRLGEGLFN